jgi:hypothetical protein
LSALAGTLWLCNVPALAAPPEGLTARVAAQLGARASFATLRLTSKTARTEYRAQRQANLPKGGRFKAAAWTSAGLIAMGTGIGIFASGEVLTGSAVIASGACLARSGSIARIRALQAARSATVTALASAGQLPQGRARIFQRAGWLDPPPVASQGGRRVHARLASSTPSVRAATARRRASRGR